MKRLIVGIYLLILGLVVGIPGEPGVATKYIGFFISFLGAFQIIDPTDSFNYEECDFDGD